MEWNDIGSAPTDGTIILIARMWPRPWVYAAYWGLADGVARCGADKRYPWVILDEINGTNCNAHDDLTGPSHWAEFPSPPKE